MQRQSVCYLQVGTPLSTFPSTAGIVAEPFGVVLIISTWNFPLRMLKHLCVCILI